MGRSIDPTELKYKYKLSTNFFQDSTNEQEIDLEMAEMNENLAEMVQAIEQLNSHLEEYVRALTEHIDRFRQMLRPHVTEEINRAIEGHNDALHLISQDLDREIHREEEVIRANHARRQRRMMEVSHNIREQIRPIRAFDRSQNQRPSQEGFFAWALRQVSNGFANFVDLLALSS